MSRFAKNFTLVLFLSVSIYSLSGQENRQRVSILPFTASEGVSKTDAQNIGKIFEVSLIKTNFFNVIEQAQRDKVLEAQEDSLNNCTDESCAIEIGKLLTADNIFLGNVSKIGSKFIVTLKLIDIGSARSIRAETIEASTVDGLAGEMQGLASLISTGESTGGRGRIIIEEEKKIQDAAATETQKEVYASVTFDSNIENVSFRVYDVSGKLLQSAITPTNISLAAATYTIEASDSQNLYYLFKDRLTINQRGKITYQIELKPNFGSVFFESDPIGADVLLNGIKIGDTPFEKREFRSGKYEFVIKKEFYESKSITVKIDDNSTTKVSQALVPMFLWLSISEGKGIPAILFIDGIMKGNLPLRIQLPLKDLNVQIISEDKRYKDYSEKIPARAAGQEVQRKISLEPRLGTVWVSCDPFLRDGQITIGEKLAGNVGDELELFIGEYVLSVKGMNKENLYSGKQTISIKEGQRIEIVIPVFLDQYAVKVQEWLAKINTISLHLDQNGKNVETDLLEAKRTLAEMQANKEAATPEVMARTKNIIDRIQKKQDEIALKINELELKKQGVKEKRALRKTLDAWGWISAASSAVLYALTGFFWIQSDSAYSVYNSSSYTIDALASKNLVITYDVGKIASGIFGLAATALSPILFLTGPKLSDLDTGDNNIDQELAKIR